MKLKIRPILEKTARYMINIGLFLFFLYLLAQLIIYIAFFYKLHMSSLYVGPEYKPTALQDEDTKTITWIIHKYLPIHNAGSEWMAHAMNEYLIHNSEYKANVIVYNSPVSDYERVFIATNTSMSTNEHLLTHSALIMTHHTEEPNAVLTSKAVKRPVICLMHDDGRRKFLSEYSRMSHRKNIYLIHNSNWLKKYYGDFNFESFVLYPPVFWKDYITTTTREYVVLINCNRNKGGITLVHIAKAMPDVQFLGVKGAYNVQSVDRKVPNIKYIEQTNYIKSIYAQTDILLMPSKEESWGRTAIEAMSSGIPVIANPTPGLLESCGEAGIFCKRDDIQSWVREIRRLKDDKEHYKRISEACSQRAKNLDPAPQLKAMAEWMSKIKWRE